MKGFAFAAGLLGALAAVTALRAQTSQPPTVSVVRDTGCGCCLNWVARRSSPRMAAIVVRDRESVDLPVMRFSATS
jgi:hypothetical protein